MEFNDNQLSQKVRDAINQVPELEEAILEVDSKVESIDVDNSEFIEGNAIDITTRTTSEYNNAVACWHFEDDEKDSIKQIDLTIQGNITDTECKFGTKSFAPYMIESPTSISVLGLDVNKPLTLDFWAKADTVDGGILNVGFTGVQFANKSLLLSLTDGGQTSIQLKTSTKVFNLDNSKIQEGMFNHFAITYTGTSSKASVFINGKRVLDDELVDTTTGFISFVAQKTNEDSEFYLDEIRISNVVQYKSNFAVPQRPYEKHINTIAVETSVTNQVAANTSAIAALDDVYEHKLTGAKANAVNSGIDATKVAQIETNETNISNLDKSLNNRITQVSNTLQGNIDKKSNILKEGTNVTLTNVTEGGLDKVRIDVDMTIPEDVWRSETLTQGNAITIDKVMKPVIDSKTSVLLHFDNDSANSGKEENAEIYPNDNVNVDYSDTIYKFGLAANLTTSSGTDSILTTLDTNLGTNDWTIDFWCYISSTSTGNFNIGLPNNSPYDNHRGLRISGSTGSDKATVNVNMSTTNSDWTQIAQVDDNTWNHFAIEKENGAWKYYVNGYLKSKITHNISEGKNIVIPYMDDTTIFVDELRISREARYKLQNLDDHFTPFEVPYAPTTEQDEYNINVTVENSLISTSETTPLSAAQGRSLNLNKRETVKVGEVDPTQASVDLPVASNTSYRFGRLTRLNITSVPETDYESTIYFQAGAENCLSIPSVSKVIGSISTEENKYYAVSILNGIVIMGEVTVPGSNEENSLES